MRENSLGNRPVIVELDQLELLHRIERPELDLLAPRVVEELAEYAGVPVLNGLNVTVQEGGFVEQTGADKTYRLGPEILRLARLREAAVPLTTASRCCPSTSTR